MGPRSLGLGTVLPEAPFGESGWSAMDRGRWQHDVSGGGEWHYAATSSRSPGFAMPLGPRPGSGPRGRLAEDLRHSRVSEAESLVTCWTGVHVSR